MRTQCDAGRTEPSRGAHLCEEDGACLMEIVSQSAGETWSDSPNCTHPLLAHVARLVNDATSDKARPRLVAYVPELALARGEGSSTYPQVVLACADVATRYRRTARLAYFERIARAQLRRQVVERSQLRRGAPRRMAQRLYQRGPAYRSVEAAVTATEHLAPAERDEALSNLLMTALAIVLPRNRSHEGATQRGMAR